MNEKEFVRFNDKDFENAIEYYEQTSGKNRNYIVFIFISSEQYVRRNFYGIYGICGICGIYDHKLIVYDGCGDEITLDNEEIVIEDETGSMYTWRRYDGDVFPKDIEDKRDDSEDDGFHTNRVPELDVKIDDDHIFECVCYRYNMHSRGSVYKWAEKDLHVYKVSVECNPFEILVLSECYLGWKYLKQVIEKAEEVQKILIDEFSELVEERKNVLKYGE